MANETPTASATHWLKEGVQALLFVLICQAAGFLGSVATETGEGTWYQMLEKPAFTPPDAVFAPVWIFLYTLMGIAAYLIWRKGWNRPGIRLALGFFGTQLLLNAAWSLVFFGLESIFGGLIVIVLLWITLACTMWLFFGFSRLAGGLLAPYLLWVTYATALNIGILALN